MSEHMKKHHISAHAHGSALHVTHLNKKYVIPKKIAEQYIVEIKKPTKIKKAKTQPETIQYLFKKLDEKFTKSGVLLRGLRLKEGLSQIQFSKKISVTQANLSNMENGRRPIGKIIAKRIEKVFGVNYRYFIG